jgi:hypothetical protein
MLGKESCTQAISHELFIGSLGSLGKLGISAESLNSLNSLNQTLSTKRVFSATKRTNLIRRFIGIQESESAAYLAYVRNSLIAV